MMNKPFNKYQWLAAGFLVLGLSACSEQTEESQSGASLETKRAETPVQQSIAAPKAKQVKTIAEPHGYKFSQLTAAELEQALTVESSRVYAVFEFNAPSVVLNLPKIENSEFASIRFETPQMLNAEGGELEYELIRGLYRPEYFTKAIRFADKVDRETPINFAQLTGTIAVDYPLLMSTEVFLESGERRGINVAIEKNSVVVTGNIEKLAGKADFFLTRSPVSVFNDQGERLEPRSGKPTWANNGKIEMFFDQIPQQVHIAFTDQAHSIVLPYDLKPAKLLPENTRGIRPK